MSNFDLKVKYDTQLDELFFSKDFKNAMHRTCRADY